MNYEDAIIGTVNFVEIDVYSEPNVNSSIVCKIRYMSEVVVDLKNSTDNFYKICSAIGADGFCQKSLITLK